ncbi:MAG: hypothetical protein RL693_1922 [Verrucomicrobiota bacterium]
MAIDGIPVVHPFHQRLKELTDPFFDMTGLWQGEWSLFAPEPIKVTQRTGVEMIFADGSTSVWESPHWETVGQCERFLGFRKAEFYDAMVTDGNQGAWPCFLDYILGKYGRQEGSRKEVVKARLIRHIRMIPLPGHAESPEQSVVLHIREYRP